jgi:hypothetical protein
MTRTRRTATAGLAALALTATSVVVPATLGAPKPPTNGGNGGGSSGQCTGSPVDRPASCASATTKGP